MEEFKRCLYPYSRYEINENGIIRNFLTKINKKTRLNYQGYLVVSLVNDFVDNNKYKIGYTSNLKKRLAVYNTNKSDKISYGYYKKTNCAKEIEICLKALLNKYIYRKNSEYYNCDLDIIINAINI